MNAERLWWAVLVRATEQQTIEIRRDIDACMRARDVELQARGELVQLGINLDELGEADDTFLALYREATERESRRAGAWKRLLAGEKDVLAEVEAIVADAKKRAAG